jgi:hypothetical protein
MSLKRISTPVVLSIAILAVTQCTGERVSQMPETTTARTPVVTPTHTPLPITTPTPSSPVPTRTASSLFDVAWDDRAIFREGLIDADRAVLDGLLGATVYHIDLQIPGDFTLLRGREEVHYTNREDEPLDEVYFRLFPNVAGGGRWPGC